MRISFPQNLFDSPPKSNIDLGKQKSKEAKILFCGIARNVEKTIQYNIEKISYLGKYFDKYDIFIYENDSTDNTKNILAQYPISYISEGRNDENYRDKISLGQDDNHYNRCKILASCRNEYLEYAKINCESFDYLCVLDWDIRGFSYKGFFDSIFRLENDPYLASVSSYGVLSEYTNTETLEENSDRLLMYDSLAFRPLNFTGPLYPNIQLSYNYFTINNPIIVRSNFGGLCIYKMKNILLFKYDAKLCENFVDCDHVTINDQIANSGFKHMLNPFLVTSYSNHRFINA